MAVADEVVPGGEAGEHGLDAEDGLDAVANVSLSATANQGPVAGLSPDGSGTFDFTLTGPMWCEFAQASNAYGRGVRVLGALCAFVGFVILFMGIHEDLDMGDLLVFAFIGGVGLLAFTRSYSSWLVMRITLWSAPAWFPVPELNTRRAQETVSAWRDGNFDGRWNTPCRLLVDGDGVDWLWHRASMNGGEGEDREVRVAWSDLACVRLTEHDVVLSPSAAGKSGVDIIPAVPDVKFADLTNCVMVDRSVLPDVDGFVAWCRACIADAAVARPKSDPRYWLRRFWSWLYADHAYLDASPAWSAA
ncbi:hypothetical protein [Bifidobacterium sp. ESL0790]|uniref:hypothetical protein n=1 Tax=Bifidobacterium sp. ESL0790 TaxID=2983233 RepID=UPI0023F7188B|nr:hypothetical protein [Bifidobacterium sp. ESL0790]WEV72825.1 hypothetical protein OZY47_02320 [Bifidobacterium sp. ESL0790]